MGILGLIIMNPFCLKWSISPCFSTKNWPIKVGFMLEWLCIKWSIQNYQLKSVRLVGCDHSMGLAGSMDGRKGNIESHSPSYDKVICEDINDMIMQV